MARGRYGFRWLEWEILTFIISLPYLLIAQVLLLFNIDISSGKFERIEKLPMKARLLSLPLGLGGHDAEAAAPSAVDVDDGGKAGLHVDVVVVRCTKALPSRIISVSVTVVTVTLLWSRSGEPLRSL